MRFASGDGVELAGTLFVPHGEGPHPGIVFVQGRSYGSRDQFIEHARRATERGLAALVFDGRGAGDSGGVPGEHTLEDRLGDAEAAFEALRGHPRVHPARVGLLGHSAGGWVVPVVAQRRPEVAFLVLHAGPAVSLAEQQGRVVQEVMKRSDRNFTEEDYAAAYAYQHELVTKAGAGEPWSALAGLVASIDDQPWAGFVDRPDSDEHSELGYFRRNPHDSRAALRSTTIPVLALYGGTDWIVPAEGNVEALDQVLTTAGNTDYEIVVIEGADHGLERSDDGHPPEYWETLLAWLVAVSETGTPP